MSTPSRPSTHVSSHNAAVVIWERIKEKRLFEAQFLFNLLDEDDMPAQERLTLERELEGLLAVVRDLQLQANKYLAEGEHVLARKMHREMERIAIDVPGLDGGKRYVDEQDTAGLGTTSSTSKEVPEPIKEEGDGESGVEDRDGREGALAQHLQRWQSAARDACLSIGKGRLLLVASLLVLLMVSVLFLNLMRREYSDASLKAQAEEDVAIKPLSVRQGESSTVHTDQPSQAQQMQGGSPASGSAAISIGELSVEPGSVQ
ncbi:MAG: hypothetical protein GX087_08935 [Desulfobulbaceae bacterium]|nr:hypothetical protein [Desulfobulbaceae bacterium]